LNFICCDILKPSKLRKMVDWAILTLKRCCDLILPISEWEWAFCGLLSRDHLLGLKVLRLEHILLGLAVMNHHILGGKGCQSRRNKVRIRK
jgi:hypothetical protein